MKKTPGSGFNSAAAFLAFVAPISSCGYESLCFRRPSYGCFPTSGVPLVDPKVVRSPQNKGTPYKPGGLLDV